MPKLQRILHPCPCGYVAPNYKQYRKHQVECAEWKNRPDPRGMSLGRRSKTISRKKPEVSGEVPSPRQLFLITRFYKFLKKHDMDYADFSAFLWLLDKKRR